MATIKFSEFPQGNIKAGTAQVVGLEGTNNVRFTPSELVDGLATQVYVDAEVLNLQNQVTQNTNDIANANLDVSGIEANITTLQGQVSVLQGNVVVLEGAVAALENNVSINQDDITVIRGNITLIESQIAELEANGNIQTLSLDNSSNVLSISGGNSVDFTTVLANVVGADAQTLTYDSANSNLSISGGNTVSLPPNQTLTWDQANSNLSISGGNTVTLPQIDLDAVNFTEGSKDGVKVYNNMFITNGLSNGVGTTVFFGSQNEYDNSGTGYRWATGFTPLSGFKYAPDGNAYGMWMGASNFAVVESRYAGTKWEYQDIIHNVNVNGGQAHHNFEFDDTEVFVIDYADDEARFTIGNVTVNGDNVLQTLTWDQANSNLSISGGNTVTINVGGGGGGNYSNANVQALGEAGWTGNIIPSANITYDLGNATNRWKDLYLSNATIYLGDQTISINNEGTMQFSGNISAQNIIDETSLIIHGGIINTTQAGTTDGLEWEAIDLPGGSSSTSSTKMATNGSGILACGYGSRVTFSKDGGETWQTINPRNDLGFAYTMNNVRVHYISAIDTFFIAGNQRYYFTTQDFVTFSGQLFANPGGWDGVQDIADDGTTLAVISAARSVHYIPVADVSNQAGWTLVINNLWTGGGKLIYNGTRFVSMEAGSTNVQSSTDGITWVNLVATGVSQQRGIAYDDTGKIVVTGSNNIFAVSTDDGVTWTTTDISSQVEWGATMKLSDVAYGDGLWVISGYTQNDIQYVSEDLITWSKIETNAIGTRDISFMSYAGDAFYGQNQDGNYKLEWPVGKQLLLFNSNVVATRSDISYVVSSAKLSSQQHLSTAWLTITPNAEEANANANTVSHTEIVFNESETSLDITANAQPVARITSGVLVQVHGSWDASAGAAFSWATDEIASHGINTVTRDGAGIYTVEFETPFATNAYTVTTGVGSTDYSGTGASPRQVSVLTRNAGNCTVICERADDAVNEDNLYMSLMVCGIVATQ